MQMKLKPGLGAYYSIWPINGSGVFYGSQDPHGAVPYWMYLVANSVDIITKSPALAYSLSSAVTKHVQGENKNGCLDVAQGLSGIVVNAVAFGPRGRGLESQPCHYSTG